VVGLEHLNSSSEGACQSKEGEIRDCRNNEEEADRPEDDKDQQNSDYGEADQNEDKHSSCNTEADIDAEVLEQNELKRNSNEEPTQHIIEVRIERYKKCETRKF
jgi:hypothetical protein